MQNVLESSGDIWRGGKGWSISSSKQPPFPVIEIINHFLFTADNGFLILTLQDGIIVKIEKTEKYIISSKDGKTGYIKYGKSSMVHPLQKKIIAELEHIQYGQIVIRINNGKVEQIEKTEKRRLGEFGLDGSGI